MNKIIQYIVEKVDPKRYYKTIFPEAQWTGINNEARVLSPFISEKTPSFSINGDTGAWYSFCEDDKRGGNSIVSFCAELNKISSLDAAVQLYGKFIHPIIPDKKIIQWHKLLWKTPTAKKYLNQRFITDKTIEEYHLGWNGERFVIPIKNEFELYVNAKLYLPTKNSKLSKMLHYTKDSESRSYGSPPMLYPLEILDKQNTIAICEGELDTLALISRGIPAVTTTSGAQSWPKQYNDKFMGKSVIVIYDNDSTGRKCTNIPVKNLKNLVKSICVLKVPKKVGKDVTDWIKSNKLMRLSKNWLKCFNRLTPIITNLIEKPTKIRFNDISLDKISQAKWFNKKIKVSALITGKGISPYLLPKRIRLSCSENCDGCHIIKKDNTFYEHTTNLKENEIIAMTDNSQSVVRNLLLKNCGIKNPRQCIASIDILETFNVEFLTLIPTLDSNVSQYVTQGAYYMGHGLKTNRAYQFEGTVVPHPKNQTAICFFTDSKPAQSEIETFKITPDVKQKLKIFQPGKLTCLAKLFDIADWQSRNITKIYERPDLHIFIDLVYHSAPSFWFNQELIYRGCLDGLVLGDTRCGKGYVTQRLQKYYKLGEIASGENCSFAGLIGGLQQLLGRWLIAWGLLPLNHLRLVILDEASYLTESEIGRMSRVRSEGVAEITKIIRESTQANTRIIWLANPRSGKPILSYNSGVEAIKELVGANEDVSRFDFAITVASDEVPSEIINTIANCSIGDIQKYPQELCRDLILWIWSRKLDQIRFTHKAEQKIIDYSIQFGKLYSSIIPLVQAENIRYKLAKVSVATAGRLFSTDESGEILIIDEEHVDTAAQFTKMIYSKPSMSYDTYSKSAKSNSIQSDKQLKDILSDGADDVRMVMAGLLELHRINSYNLGDYVGDDIRAKLLIGSLVRNKCLIRDEKNNWYVKNSSFTTWLKEQFRSTKNG